MIEYISENDVKKYINKTTKIMGSGGFQWLQPAFPLSIIDFKTGIISWVKPEDFDDVIDEENTQ